MSTFGFRLFDSSGIKIWDSTDISYSYISTFLLTAGGAVSEQNNNVGLFSAYKFLFYYTDDPAGETMRNSQIIPPSVNVAYIETNGVGTGTISAWNSNRDVYVTVLGA